MSISSPSNTWYTAEWDGSLPSRTQAYQNKRYPNFKWGNSLAAEGLSPIISSTPQGALNELLQRYEGSDGGSTTQDTAPNEVNASTKPMGGIPAGLIGAGISTGLQYGQIPGTIANPLGAVVTSALQGKATATDLATAAAKGALTSAIPGLGLTLGALSLFGIDPIAEAVDYSNIAHPGLPMGFGYSWGMRSQPDDPEPPGLTGLPSDIDAFSEDTTLSEAVASGNWGGSADSDSNSNSGTGQTGESGSGTTGSASGTGAGGGVGDGLGGDGVKRGGLIQLKMSTKRHAKC